MNIKTIRNNDSDSSVARNVSNMMLNNYKKGLAISNNELAVENGISDSVGIVDPTETIRTGKSKVVSVAKGYNVKSINGTEVPKLVNSSSQQAKEFIIQSKALDNELDHVVAHMKLNNKDEFYDSSLWKDGEVKGGTLFTKKEKSHFTNKATDEEIHALMEDLQRTITDKESNGDNADDEYQNFMWLERLFDDSSDYADRVKGLGRYDKLDPLDRATAQDILERGKGKIKYGEEYNTEMASALKDMGYAINVNRNVGKGKNPTVTNLTSSDLWSSYNGENDNLKSKNGVRVVNTIGVEAFSQDLLLAIKKISNHLTAVLLPLAQKMYETRFQGITLQDKNTVIPDLYKELDEKMYILTSLNNQDNTQLIKIDKDFDKLYSLVTNGLNMYVMPTGGSITGGSIKGGDIRSTTNYLYEL
jgi:hypothetical protein